MGRYPEGASSNPTRVNIFQLTSAVLDYHERIDQMGENPDVECLTGDGNEEDGDEIADHLQGKTLLVGM